jgi:hypothetical protein
MIARTTQTQACRAPILTRTEIQLHCRQATYQVPHQAHFRLKSCDPPIFVPMLEQDKLDSQPGLRLSPRLGYPLRLPLGFLLEPPRSSQSRSPPLLTRRYLPLLIYRYSPPSTHRYPPQKNHRLLLQINSHPFLVMYHQQRQLSNQALLQQRQIAISQVSF